MREVVVDGSALTVDDVVAVAHGQARVSLGADVPRRMETSRSVVVQALGSGAPVYGVNTGFGALADTPVGVADLTALQGAIVRSHAAAVGVPLDDQAVRAILLLRARTLAAGYSGVRAELPARLLELLERDLLPVIPGKGSVGASGDLAQLAHLAQPLIGEGRLRAPGDPAVGRPAAEVLREHGIEPLTLAPKEGLSLVNGTEPMQALLAFSVYDAEMLVQAADVACALSVEALLGTDRPYDERVQVIRPHPGQLVSAANLRALLAGSPLLASHRHSRHAVQDAYCLRCAPQVHGAVRDVLGFARQVVTIELGSVVDNPVIVPDGEVMTTGNFHGEPLAFAADMLAMAVAELASISERRVDRMLDPAFSRGLPPFLAPAAGTNSGFMLAQYTAASLVSENKVLAHPASVDTIPTSGKQEDHVSMGWTSARKLREVVGNVRACLAVEICCATQGIDLRESVAQSSVPLRAVHDLVRSAVPRMDVDREVAAQLAAVDMLLPEICRVAAEGLRLVPVVRVTPEVRRARNAVAVTFTGFGFATASWAARIPDVRAALHVNPGVLGLILLFGAAGSGVSVPLAGIVIARFGEARVVAVAAIVAATGLGVAAVGYQHGIPPVAAGLFGFGAGAGAGDVAMNIEGTAVERGLGRAILPKFHAGWSIGTVAGAALGTVMVAWHVSVTAHLLAVGVAVGVTLAAVTRDFLPRSAQLSQGTQVSQGAQPAPGAELAPGTQSAQGEGPAQGAGNADRRSPLAAWTEPRTLTIGLFVLCVTVIEGMGNSWLSLGVIDGYRASAVLGTAALSVFLAAMTVGRWFGPGAIDRFGRVAVLRTGVVVALAGVLLIGAGHYLPVALIGAVLMGLGISLGFPVGMSAAADDPRYAAGRVSAAASLGYLALLAGPPVIGALADGVGILDAMMLAGVLLVAALFFVHALAPLSPVAAQAGSR